ncbi:MAG: rubrerythrin family protein [Clostridia bacterium]|nr:rubrerythrin family protein [Clostridia bacterium]
MVEFKSSKTRLNLARAFAGECQDGAKYQFLAKQAEKEGYAYLKTLFKTHAKNEMAHAKKFFDLIAEYSDEKNKNIDISGGYAFCKGDLLTSIQDTINVEDSQSTVVYPDFAKEAEDEGYPDIAKAFRFAGTVENCHKLLLEQVLEQLQNDTMYSKKQPTKWKCSNCGFEHTDKDCWDVCPSCDMGQGYAEIKIDMNSGD